ncbi:MAG: sigma-70 family RNA polymerase sigma factor [Cyclobacteriaceae bacterium]|nr:sigma-70 family RNA polymerase sigma factor [Cyclobacteriaceae bacterium]
MEDRELIIILKDPERKNYGFNLLVQKYQAKIYWHIRRLVIDHEDADDLVQDTFIRVFKNLESFRQDSKLYTWIYRIATNVSLTHLSSKKRKFFLPIVDVNTSLISSLDQSTLVTEDEIMKKLHKALLKLPEKQRLVFNMKYFDDLKYEDISEITGTSVGALKASYHLAVKKIEDYLNNN